MHPEFGQNFTRTRIMAEKMGYVHLLPMFVAVKIVSQGLYVC
jgi:hypothetical protein